MTNEEIKKRKSDLALQARVLRLEELVNALLKDMEKITAWYWKEKMK
jgi:hypothetical protein